MCFHIMLKPILSMSCGTVMPSYDDLSVRAAESCYVCIYSYNIRSEIRYNFHT